MRVASLIDMPGTAVGMKRMVPSLSGGMNSPAQAAQRNNRGGHQPKASKQRQPAKPQNKMRHRMIKPNQQAVDGVFVFRRDAAADQQDHQHRRQRHGQHRGEEHGEVLVKASG
jgi:hypothetical protein